jgi:salicylate biosynthesis isochorismate synthase
VVDAVVDSLECLQLTPLLPAGPTLLRLHGIQHLHTPINCDLPSCVGILDVVGALHPTPAVSGAPTGRAIELRGIHEHLDRGWFAGPVGWLDADGNGEFRVALRSALIDDLGTTLFAGAGVVAGSDPERELLETEVKLGTMLGPVLATSGVPEGTDR